MCAHGARGGVRRDSKDRRGHSQIPLADAAIRLLMEWKCRSRNTERSALVFETRDGKPMSPNNGLRRAVFPACSSVGLPHATWLTFRRTCSSWLHADGVPAKVIAELMGHANVDTTLTCTRKCSTAP